MLGIGVDHARRAASAGSGRGGVLGFALGVPRDTLERRQPREVVVWSALFAAMLRYATPLVFAAIGGMFSER